MFFSTNEFFNLVLHHAQHGRVDQCALLLNRFEEKIHPLLPKERYSYKFVALMGSLLRVNHTQKNSIDLIFPYLDFDTPQQKTYFLSLAVAKQSVELVEMFLPVSDFQTVHDQLQDEKDQQFLKAVMERKSMKDVIPDMERGSRPIKKI